MPAGNHYGVYEECCMDGGLGIEPELMGKDNGIEFGLFIFDSIEETRKGLPVRLTVATFNKRAIHLYIKLGFVLDQRFSTEYGEFITMVKK